MKKIIWGVMFGVVGCLFLVLFLSVLYFSFLFSGSTTRNNQKDLTKDHHPNFYRFYERDYTNDQVKSGVLSLFLEEEEVILEDGFISTNDETLQKRTLIFPFDSEEYECFGSCYCKEGYKEGVNILEENERRSSTVIGRSVSYLLAATSTLMAMNIARNYFSTKCEEKYSHVCLSERTESVIDWCQRIMEAELELDEPYVKMRTYYCNGHCVDNPRLSSSSKSSVRQSRIDLHGPKEVECEKLKMDGEVIVYSNDLLRGFGPATSEKTKMLETAKYIFQIEDLNIFCTRESTSIKHEEISYEDEVNFKTSLCSSVNDHGGFENIQCYMPYHRPEYRRKKGDRKQKRDDNVWWDDKKRKLREDGF